MRKSVLKRLAGAVFPRPSGPTAIPGCQLWLDSASLNGLSDGDPVATWSDSSGNGHDFSQSSSGNRPTLRKEMWGGESMVEFDGANPDFLDGLHAALQIDPKSQPVTVAAVLYQASGEIGSIIGWRDANEVGYQLFTNFDTEPGWNLCDIVTTVPQSLHGDLFRLLGTSEGSEGVLRINGEVGYTIPVGDLDAPSGAYPVQIGARGDGAGGQAFTLDGLVGEIVVYDRALNAFESAQLDKYFRHRWQAVALGPKQQLMMPLTYDELLSDDATSLTRQGDGPWITGKGFAGNGYDARYTLDSLPGWVTSEGSALAVHASIAPYQGPRNSTRDVLVSVGDSSSPKLELAVVEDAEDSDQLQIAARCYTGATQVKRMCRREWRYQRRFPGLTFGGFSARPQALCFMDSTTLLVTAHYENEFSRCYRIDLTNMSVTGSFAIDANNGISNSHVGSIAKRSDGSFWFSENSTRVLYEVDLDASFASNQAVFLASYDASVVESTSAIAWATISGTEYLLIGEYRESGTPYLYVIPGTEVVDEGTFALADRAKRFEIEQRCQGLVYNGALYVSSNRFTADAQATGRVYSVDIDTEFASTADGDSVTVVDDWAAPSQYPEDVDLHPVTGELWTSTEGQTSVGSDDGFISIWSSALDHEPVENHYTLDYDGDGTVTIKINGQLFEAMSWTPTVEPDSLAIGGAASAPAGQTEGFCVATIKNVLVQDRPLSASDYAAAVAGDGEPNSLTVYNVTLTNPGAETGDTTGWTDEVGSLDAKNFSSRNPFGDWYFDGGSNAQTIARQRIDIATATGMTTTEIDAAASAGELWARVDWQQNGFTSGSDSGSAGLRTLDGSAVVLSENYSGIINMEPTGDLEHWVLRGLSVPVPDSSRELDVLLRSDRNDGTNNDTYFDEVKFTIYRQE